MKCVACGSHSLVQGTITHAGMADLRFSPDDTSILAKIFDVGTRPIYAHACTHCFHVQFTVEFTDSDREKYRSFEGDTPTAVDEDEQEQ